MTRPLTALVAILAASLSAGAGAATELDYRVDTATEILQDLRRIPETAIPPQLLASAYAVAVIPSVIKAGFILGGTYGKGILVVRRADGQWSNPAFVQLTGGSLGFQAGAQSTDFVLVFKTQRGLEGISRGKITLGGEASIAAGPVGRQATASTDLQMQTEIYSYARSRGFFAGVSLQGAALSMDRKANQAYYEDTTVSAARILTDTTIPAPVSGRRFMDTLAATAPALNSPNGSRAASRDSDMEVAVPEGARTFGIEEGTAPAGEGSL
jgi:lipid-binding SYLF domain-containing protein